MKAFFSPALRVASHSLRLHLRDRFFGLFLLFSLLLIYSSLLVGVMAVYQERRALVDFGLALMELMGLAFCVYASATAVSSEVETKTIYLVFSRPVPRHSYLLGKMLAVFGAAAVLLAATALMHSSLLLLRGHAPDGPYFAALAYSWLKLTIISSLVFAVSMFSTSSLSSMVIGFILWMLGHFAPETVLMAAQAAGEGSLLELLARLIPNFQLFNFKDALDVRGAAAPPLAALPYAAAWWTGSYGFAWALLRRKEF
ncbi:MAG TPA: ABC transporter permease subunit [Elusimicrobiales bacterium]|nr:ABC transporter permease subunit [Elusimicrobiales bacterium]